MLWNQPIPRLILLASLMGCDSQQLATPVVDAVVSASNSGRRSGQDDDDRGILPLSRFANGDHDAACDASAFRAFDFWVGRWHVTASGRSELAGTNLVTKTLDGCAIEEHWSDTAGVRGRSLNSFDSNTRTWSQLWMDQTGGALELSGRGNDHRMQLAGTHPTSRFDATPFTDRITWTAVGRNRLRQVGEASINGGAFSTVYDLTYSAVRNATTIAPSTLEFCASPARPRFHAFDFMLGDWTIRRSGSSSKIRSSVSTDLGGCLVEERLSGPGGYEAVAYSGFRSATFVWNWMFMDNRGVQLLLSGPATLTGNTMTLAGRKTDRRGRVVDVRVEWISMDANTVEQRWVFSTDGGITWSAPEVVVMSR